MNIKKPNKKLTVSSSALDFEQIRGLLPQRFPFLMLDKITRLEAGKRAIGIKNITGNEIFFLGHFPGEAIMPGALIAEAMAQTSIILFSKSKTGPFKRKNKIFLFSSIKGRFLHPVVPGDQLIIEVKMIKAVTDAAIVQATVTVENRVVAKAELSFAARDRGKLKRT